MDFCPRLHGLAHFKFRVQLIASVQWPPVHPYGVRPAKLPPKDSLTVSEEPLESGTWLGLLVANHI